MEQKQESFEQQLQYGEDGEKLIGENFMSKGFCILPVYQFTKQSAPLLYSQYANYILPDMVVLRNSECAFVEAKRKRQYVCWNGKVETGIDYRKYLQYMKVHELTGLDVIVVFLHEIQEPTGIFWLNLCTEGRYWNGKNHKGEVCEKPLFLWETKHLRSL